MGGNEYNWSTHLLNKCLACNGPLGGGIVRNQSRQHQTARDPNCFFAVLVDLRFQNFDLVCDFKQTVVCDLGCV